VILRNVFLCVNEANGEDDGCHWPSLMCCTALGTWQELYLCGCLESLKALSGGGNYALVVDGWVVKSLHYGFCSVRTCPELFSWEGRKEGFKPKSV
jgi:hypothetical protein